MGALLELGRRAYLHPGVLAAIIVAMTGLAVWAVAVFFFGMGVLALVDPERFAEPLGLSPEPLVGNNEIRAVYGGFGIAVSVLILYAASRPELRPGVFTAVAAALWGMAAGRLVSAAIERGAHPLMWTFMAGETLLGSILFVVR